ARQLRQKWHVELDREGAGELIFIDQLQSQQHLAEQAAFFALTCEPALDRILGDLAFGHQDLADHQRVRRDANCDHYGLPPPLGAGGGGGAVWPVPWPLSSGASIVDGW